MSSEADDKQFASLIEQDRAAVERRCEELLALYGRGEKTIEEALRYVLLGCGKRLRPLLCLWTHDAAGGRQREACLDVACAIECLHTYSLVHDDLPCMDDDDMRRGKPSAHKAWGEAIAVLAGDALLTLCFEILVTLGERWPIAEGTIIETSRIVARAAGTGGLITGQVLDLSAESLDPTLEMVETIHRHKTAALIAAAMETGAVVAGAPPDERERFRRAGLGAGEAFQIIDDVLDLQMDEKTLGKTPGKDVKDGKLTYPSLAGVRASKARAAALIDEARGTLGSSPEGIRLGRLLGRIVERIS